MNTTPQPADGAAMLALAKRIKKASGISLMEQPSKPGPLWAMPLGDKDQQLIEAALRAAAQPPAQPQGEAVAWQRQWRNGEWETIKDDQAQFRHEMERQGWKIRALVVATPVDAIAQEREALRRVLEWYGSLPPSIQQDIEGSGAVPGCIAHANAVLAASPNPQPATVTEEER